MIVDSMTKAEVLHSLQKEFKDEILPYYNNSILKWAEKHVLPIAQRSGRPQTYNRSKISSGNNTFNIIGTITKKGYDMCVYSEFDWQNKHCYASYLFSEKGDVSVVIFQKHCLERYAERVLQEGVNFTTSPKEVFMHYLLNKQDNAFIIVLPAPKRERSLYYGLADALFLGDFDAPNENNKENFLYWFRTCLSLKETHETQKGVLHSLAKMQRFAKTLSFNPLPHYLLDKGKRKVLDDYINKSQANEKAYIEFLEYKYMLFQLQLSFDFDWIGMYIDETNKQMEDISKELAKYNVNTASLSPYGKTVGFAIKGEIDYKGED